LAGLRTFSQAKQAVIDYIIRYLTNGGKTLLVLSKISVSYF